MIFREGEPERFGLLLKNIKEDEDEYIEYKNYYFPYFHLCYYHYFLASSLKCLRAHFGHKYPPNGRLGLF